MTSESKFAPIIGGESDSDVILPRHNPISNQLERWDAASRTYVPAAGVGNNARNSAVLSIAAKRISQARTKKVNLGLFGDSLTTGSGATAIEAVPTNETAAIHYGLAGTLRDILNRPFGTGGGGWLSAASTDAALVTRNSATSLTAYGPHYALTAVNSYTIDGAGDYIEFNVPACTDIQVMTYENGGLGSALATLDVTVDGGAATVATGSGGTDIYRLWQVANMTGLADTAHTIRLTRTGSNGSHICGVLYSKAVGITPFSMGVGSASSEHLSAAQVSAGSTYTALTAAQAARIATSTFKTIPLDVAIIVVGHNDCSQQVARSLTPAVTAANIQTVIDYLRLNAGAPIILLVTDPDTSLTGSPLAYSDWWDTITALADGTDDVAAITTRDIMGTFTEGNADGLYADTIHWSSKGYAAWGWKIANLLLTGKTD